jgi:pyruvate/2-oxoglutarate dehydrogenase complex dihydrolipoamide acyltransferase (E2) component
LRIDGSEAARFMNDLVAKLEDANFLRFLAEGKEAS